MEVDVSEDFVAVSLHPLYFFCASVLSFTYICHNYVSSVDVHGCAVTSYMQAHNRYDVQLLQYWK